MSKTLISISYCAQHRKDKGGTWPTAQWVDPVQHAQWLLGCVKLLKATTLHDVTVSCTGLSGSYLDGEREIMTEVATLTKAIIGMPENPNHQSGAAICIRQGIDYAMQNGYENLIHTAEDVVPARGEIRRMSDLLDAGYHYVGAAWWGDKDQPGGIMVLELNAQFFGCRTNSMAAWFHVDGVAPKPGLRNYIERYLGSVVIQPNRPFTIYPPCSYYHSHEFEAWKKQAQQTYG